MHAIVHSKGTELVYKWTFQDYIHFQAKITILIETFQNLKPLYEAWIWFLPVDVVFPVGGQVVVDD